MEKIESEAYYEAYSGSPIAPVTQNMDVFAAGAISFGVEFRVLNDDLIDELGLTETAARNDWPSLDDAGVSIHVFARNAEGNCERLRFDCFPNDPHYHYLSVRGNWHHVLHLDVAVTGDPLLWALTMLRTRLVPMLLRAEVDDAALLVDCDRIEEVMSKLAEAAYRARFHADVARINETAMGSAKAH